MRRRYKKSFSIINFILLLLSIFLIINILVFKKTSFLFLILTLLIPTVILLLTFGYEKKKRRFTYELIFYIFSYCVVFLLVTYFIGVFVGFTKNIYRLNYSNIIHNVIPYIILIFIGEVLRYEIIRKGDGSSLAYFLVVFVLILSDITLFLTTYNLDTGDGQIKFICAIVLPSIFKNIALMYFGKFGGIYPNLIYRIFIDLKLFVLPIMPNFGLYFDSIINTALPALMMFLVYLNISFYHRDDEEPIVSKKNPFYKYVIYFVLIFIILVLSVLVSSSIKYSMVSIGSGSMTPNINKGDVVIYEKVDDYLKIENGTVLVFKKDNKTVVHRIIKIEEIDENERVFYTKGDANEKEDGYPITKEQVIGVVKFRIRYIGIPSVVLSELLR